MRPIDADYLNMYLCELQMANLGADDDYCETLNEVIHIVDEQSTILEIGNCAGCKHQGRVRPQKCSCCRRNPDMKDCYEVDV